MPKIDVWEQLKPKISDRPSRVYFLKNMSKKTKTMAAAAGFLLIFGISLWWQSGRTLDPRQFATATGLPTNYQVETIDMDRPFGPPSAQTRFIWTKKHFGISIENSTQGNYPTISIGMNLSEEIAQMPKHWMKTSSELAFLYPKQESFNTNQ
ncbi:MAG: hypothetical protein HQM13_22890 [SAR324 cluster bacterium]|nr:hypothetical protein [SAR324 cluster bacterium]